MEIPETYQTYVPANRPQFDPDLTDKLHDITTLARQAGAKSASIVRDQEVSVFGGATRLLVSTHGPVIVVLVFPVSDIKERGRTVEQVFC